MGKLSQVTLKCKSCCHTLWESENKGLSREFFLKFARTGAPPQDSDFGGYNKKPGIGTALYKYYEDLEVLLEEIPDAYFCGLIDSLGKYFVNDFSASSFIKRDYPKYMHSICMKILQYCAGASWAPSLYISQPKLEYEFKSAF